MGTSESDKSNKSNPATGRDNVQDQPHSAERQSFLELTRSLASLPFDEAAAALETSAAIASISLRAGIEFLRAAPAAAQILQAAELRSWGEMGRRLAMGDYEAAATFFAEGVDGLRDLPRTLHSPILGLCLRQMTLSTVVGRETFRIVPALVAEIGDDVLFHSMLEVASEISRRSAKHSADFLKAGVGVSQSLRDFRDPSVAAKSLELAGAFALYAAGIP